MLIGWRRWPLAPVLWDALLTALGHYQSHFLLRPRGGGGVYKSIRRARKKGVVVLHKKRTIETSMEIINQPWSFTFCRLVTCTSTQVRVPCAHSSMKGGHVGSRGGMALWSQDSVSPCLRRQNPGQAVDSGNLTVGRTLSRVTGKARGLRVQLRWKLPSLLLLKGQRRRGCLAAINKTWSHWTGSLERRDCSQEEHTAHPDNR